MRDAIDPCIAPDLGPEYDRLEHEIIARHLDMATLDTANSDAKDFHTLAVWKIREALQAAYLAGLQQGRAEGKTIEDAPVYHIHGR